MRPYLRKLLTLLFFVTAVQLQAQMMIRAEGDVFNIPELSAIISEQDKHIVVLVSMDKMRPAAYKSVDLKTNDQIFMALGNKIKSVKQLQKLYEDLAIGAEFKMAIKRGDVRKLVSFTKADPEKLPKSKMRMKQVSPEEAEKLEREGGTKVIRKTTTVPKKTDKKKEDKKDD